MVHMHGESLFRADVVSREALNIRKELMKMHTSSLNKENPTLLEQEKLQVTIHGIELFNASPMWVTKRMHLNNLQSGKGLRKAGNLDSQLISIVHKALQKALC